jgi:NAD(P)-dependent dehydrogenase (short-subunit alcohol dehydrogenase family)
MTLTEPRAVLITGCSSGIGACLAAGLRARGYRVFATARAPQDVARLAREGFDAFALDLDASDSIRAAVDEVLRRCDGRLYALINNAAFGLAGAVEDLSRAALRAQFETNLFGTQELTNRVIPAMRAAGAGRIVHMSSLQGIICLGYRGAYCASKFALEALADSLRLELRGSGIYVSLIEPGAIESDFRRNAAPLFRKWIDVEASPHKHYYARVAARLDGELSIPFTLPPEAVLAKVVHALEARRPRARYPVTFPAHLFSWLRRLLPTRALDYILWRVSDGGRR